MSAERPLLTEEMVTRAESGLSSGRIAILAVIEQHLPTITQLNEEYALIDRQEQDRFVRGHYGFLADAFVEARPYSLPPEDMIAIWSRAVQVFPGGQMYTLARIVASAYAVQGIDDPAWRGFPRHSLETGQLPEEVLANKAGITYVLSELDKVSDSLDDIDFYVYGIQSPIEEAIALAKRKQGGDQNADEQIEKLLGSQRTRGTPLLVQTLENVGTAVHSLGNLLRGALEES